MREPWKPLAWQVLERITEEQAQRIISEAGFKMGILTTEIETGKDGKPNVMVREQPNVSYEFWRESVDRGYYLSWFSSGQRAGG